QRLRGPSTAEPSPSPTTGTNGVRCSSSGARALPLGRSVLHWWSTLHPHGGEGGEQETAPTERRSGVGGGRSRWHRSCSIACWGGIQCQQILRCRSFQFRNGDKPLRRRSPAP